MRSKLFYLTLLLVIPALAFTQQIQITIIPGSEYTMARRDEWKVVVYNTGNQPIDVFFRGLATEAQKGKVYEALSQVRQIAPGTSTFNTQYYVGLDPFKTIYEDADLREYAIRTNGLPAGDYEICITAYAAADSSELGTNCYSFSADYFTPPILISPENNDTVREDYPFFTWLPPVPNNGQAFTYTLSLYELQNIQSVISSVQNNPAYYERKGITMPVVQYSINARNLRPGKRYAWKVSAEVGNQTVATSEVWSFVFMKDQFTLTGLDTLAKKKEEKKNNPVSGIPYMELKPTTGNTYSVVNNGTLSFQYKNNFELKQIGYRLLDAQMQSVQTEVLDVNYGLNYFCLDLKGNGKLIKGRFYELQVTDPRGNILKARFKYNQ